MPNENMNENLSLAAWAKTQSATVEELKILVAAQGVLDWDSYCGRFEKTDAPLDRGRQTSLGGMLQQNRTHAINVPLDIVADVTCADPAVVAALAGRPECAGIRCANGGGILSTGLHWLLEALNQIAADGSDPTTACLPSMPEGHIPPETTTAENVNSKAPVPDETERKPVDAENPGVPADGANVPSGDEPTPDAPAPTEPVPDAPPAPKVDPKPDAKAKRSRPPKTKYSVGKNDLDKMLRDTSDKPFDVRKTREFLMALPEYKPQDVALMLDEEAIKKFQNEYVSVSVMAGSMILSRRNYQSLLDLLNGNVYIMPDEKEQD